MFSQAIKFFKPVIVCLLFLLAGTSTFAQTELINDPGFELRNGSWQVSTNGTNQTDSWWNINNSAGAHSGSRYQYIGADSNGILAANNVNGLLYQTVTIPAGTTSANLTYYVKITTSESSTAAYDHLYVEIRNASGTLLATPVSYSNQSASQFSSWTQQTVNLNSYAGQTLRVAFHGTTDGYTITVFRIDDVSLLVSGTTATGSLQVTLAPAGAVSAGAQWQVDGGAFQNSGVTAPGLTVGSHTVAFKPVSGWTTPTSHTATANANQTTQDSGTYVAVQPSTGSLQVTLAPAGAVSAGAQWQVDGGAFQNSGVTAPGLTVGSHTVAFKPVSGWTTPTSHTATANANQTTQDSGTYQAQSSGTFYLSFPLSSFTPYNAPTTSVFDHHGGRYQADQQVVAYTGEVGNVVDMRESPGTGVDGALLYSYKKADGSPFLVNKVNYVGTIGPSTLNYDGHPGYDYGVPVDTPVHAAAAGTVVCVNNTNADDPSGFYIQVQHDAGYLTQYLHLNHVSVTQNATVTRGQLIGLSGNTGNVGAHLHFEVKKDITSSQCPLPGTAVDPYGWTGSGSDPYPYGIVNVNLWSDQGSLTAQTITFPAQTSSRTFVSGSTFAISPLATASSGLAVTYSSITTGVCAVSGTTVTMVAAGTCTIAADRAAYGNYSAAQQATQNIVFTPPATGSLQVNIGPAGAVSAGAQWQVDSGAYQSSGATVPSLSVGNHTVAFKSISGWTAPTSHTAAVNANQTTADSGTYVAVQQSTGSLQVTIAPAGAVSAGAQWQVDGNAFQNSGANVSGLFVGGHTVAFKPITGWTTPGNHAVMVNANLNTVDSGTYVAVQQPTGSLQVNIGPAGAVSAGAQWQVDGSAYQSSGATVSGLSVGSHTVAFKSITGWTIPASYSVTINANQTTTNSGTYQAASSNQFVVNGHTLSSNQARLITYVGTDILPQLPGTRSDKLTVASRVSWWSLKEGIFSLTNPNVYSNCHTASGDVRLDPLSTCDPGQPWQVGLAAVQVPYHSDQSVLDAITELWSGRLVTDVLGEAARIAGFDPATGTGAAIVGSTGYLKRSWLLRHPAIGMYLEEPTVTSECIISNLAWCHGTGWPETQAYAPTQQASLQSISDIANILDALSPQVGTEISSLTGTTQQASWVYYQSNCPTAPNCQWYISESAGDTYLLSGANGYSGEFVWGKIANGNPVATVDYLAKTVYVASSASAQISATSYPGVKVYDGTNVTVTSSRGYTAAQQLDGQTFSHAWYFFKVQSTGIWYIVNTYDGTTTCGSSTCVYRLRLKPDNSDYDWLQISDSSWTRSFAASASSMNITLTGR